MPFIKKWKYDKMLSDIYVLQRQNDRLQEALAAIAEEFTDQQREMKNIRNENKNLWKISCEDGYNPLRMEDAGDSLVASYGT